jgi:hypothetical protein
MRARSKTWQSVVEFYTQLKESPDWDPKILGNLAAKIKNSKYANGLYPVTSMHVLYLGQSPEFDIKRGALKIELKKNQIHLELMSSYDSKKNWKRAVEPDKVFDALEKFLQSERWFVQYRQNA